MAERVCGREITNQEGNRLLRIVRRSTGSVVTWWRAQMVLLSAQGMDVAQIPRVTSPDRVRGVLHSFNLDGFDRCTRATAAAGRRPSPWPSAERSSSLPCPGRSTINCRSRRRRRTTASSTLPGDLHPPARRAALLAAYDLSRDRPYGHVKPRKRRGEFLVFQCCLRTLYPPGVRFGLVLDNYDPHPSSRDDPRVGQWAAANNVELAYTPTNASWLNRIEAQFTAPRHFAVDGTDHASHAEPASMIRRYIAWRNHNTRDRRLGETVNTANVA